MEFTDRQSTYPNRYKVTKSDGSTEYVTLERADEPTVLGTPLNAETFNGWGSEITAGLAEKAESSHNHSASNITSGTLAVNRGGTGKATHTSNAVLTGNGTGAVNNVATASGAMFATAANGAPKFGTLPVAQGGTGLTSNPAMLVNLGSTSGYSVFSASPRPGVTGTLPITHGGTGATTAEAALLKLGGVKITKLWENASPTSSFAAQTVALNLSGYDFILAFTKWDTAGTYENHHILKIGSSSRFTATTSINSNEYYMTMYARAIAVSATGVTFEDAYKHRYDQSTCTKTNANMIPTAIYGIKGVS